MKRSVKRILSLVLAILLAIPVYAFPTSAAETATGENSDPLFSGEVSVDDIDTDNAMHFLIRHWHSLGPDADMSKSDTIGAYAIMVEGYIVPGDDDDFTCYARAYDANEKNPTGGFQVIDSETASDYIRIEGGKIVLPAVPYGEAGKSYEQFSGFSVSTGQSAVNINNGTASDHSDANLTIDPDKAEIVRLVKSHVYYIVQLTKENGAESLNGDGMTPFPTYADTYINGSTTYFNTSVGLHTDKTASPHLGSASDRIFDLDLRSWFVEDDPVSVGMILDASGSMAYTMDTLGENEKINVQKMYDELKKLVDAGKATTAEKEKCNKLKTLLDRKATGNGAVSNFISTDDLKYILDPNKTDASPLGVSGYSYFIFDQRSGVKEYVPLAYWNGSENEGKVLKSGSEIIGALDDTNYNGGAGWYYVNFSGDTENYRNLGTGKALWGIYDVPFNTGAGASDTNNNTGSYKYSLAASTTASAIKFFIGADGYLCAFYCPEASKHGKQGVSYVYENPDNAYIKTEVLQRAVGTFTTMLSDKSPTSQVAAVRFSSDRQDAQANLDKFVLLNWTSDPIKAAQMLSLEYGNGGAIANDNGQYNYGLTGGTCTYNGLNAFKKYLAGKESSTANRKYLIIFTDGRDNSDAKYGNVTQDYAKQLANTLKGTDNYTIFTVLLATGTVQKPGDGQTASTEYTDAVTFLKNLASKEEYFFEATNADELVDAFANKILNQIVKPLDKYNVQDYIDPRFDIVDGNDVVWHLNADGKVSAGSNNYDLRGNTDGVEITLFGSAKGTSLTTKAQKAMLHYDDAKKMYFLVWTNQDIPTCVIGSPALTVWHGRVTVKAKDDFIGGNAVLTNGNDEAQNYVYKTTTGASSGVDKAKDTRADGPSKGFPRTTVNVRPRVEDPGRNLQTFMDENLSSKKDVLTEFIGDKVDTSAERYYWEYLERYVAYYNFIIEYNKTAENGTKLAVPPLPQVKAKDADEWSPITVTGELSLDDLLNLLVGDDEKDIAGVDLKLPYYYLDDADKSNQTGTYDHRADYMGYLTYSLGSSDNVPTDYPTSGGKSNNTTDRGAKLVATYVPLSIDGTETDDQKHYGGEGGFLSRTNGNEKLVVEEDNNHDIYGWDETTPGHKEDVGTKMDPKVSDSMPEPTEGEHITAIVSGEIKFQMVVSDEVKAYLAKYYPNEKVTYTAKLMRNGELFGTYTATYTPGGEVEVTLTYIDGSNFNVDNGLPVGNYIVEPDSNSAPLGVKFTAIEIKSGDDVAGQFDNASDKVAPVNDGSICIGSTTYDDFNENNPKNPRFNDLYGFALVPLELSIGGLTVSKTVHAATDTEKSTPFNFKVTLYNNEGDTSAANINGNYTKDSSGTIEFKNGVAEFTLAHDQSITITELPAGLWYVVEELNVNTGEYMVVDSGLTGTIPDGNDPAKADVVNVPLEDLTIKKDVESDLADDKNPEKKKWTFDITLTLPTVTVVEGEEPVQLELDLSKYTDLNLEKVSDGVYEGTFTLGYNEEQKIPDLPRGTTYTITERTDDNFTVEVTIGAEKKDAVTDETLSDTVTVTFTNTRKTGDLTVSKTVTGSEGDKTKKFHFTVTLYKEGATAPFTEDKIATEINGAYGEDDTAMTFTGGVAEFDLADGESLTATKLPVGLVYVVQEADYSKDGYGTQYTGGQTGTIAEGTAASVEVTNRKPLDNVTISKIVDSDVESDEEKTFSFKVTLTAPDGATLVPDQITVTGVENVVKTKDDDTGTVTITFTLKHNQTVTIDGLPAGTVVEVAETTADTNFKTTVVVKVGDNESSVDGAEASGTVPEDTGNPGDATDTSAAIAFTFTNTRKTGDLTISKTVATKDGTLTQADRDKEFSFKVTLYENQGDETPASVNDTYSDIVFTNGVSGTITLKHGESLTIEDLPAGLYYVVEEISHEGYKVFYSGETGMIPDGSAQGAEPAKADVVNVPLEDLVIEKVVESDLTADKAEGKKWTFDITLTLPTVTVVEGEEPVQLELDLTKYADLHLTGSNGAYTGWFELGHGDEPITIADLPRGTIYTITETTDDNFTVKVTIGAVEKDAVTDETLSDTVTVTFTNTRKTGGLTVSKTVEGRDGDKTKKFHFKVTLYKEGATAPFTDEDIATEINGVYGEGDTAMTFTGGVAEFDLADGESLTAAGLPAGIPYTVEETADNDYSVTSTGESGTIPGPNSDGETQTAEAAFTNTRKTGDLTVSKTVVGRDGDTTKKFHFTVTLYTDAEHTNQASINGVYGEGDTAMTFTGGVAEFDLADGEHLTAAGLPAGLYYEVSETPDDEYTTGSTGETGTIPGPDSDGETQTAEAAFTNTRKTGDLTVSKKVTGSEGDKTKKFTFTVTLYTDEARTNQASINGTYGEGDTAMTFVNGVAEFELSDGESLTATGLPAGLYYEVTEDAQEGYTAIITGDKGQILESSTDGQKAEAAFDNHSPEFTELNIKVTKVITAAFGNPYNPAAFVFTLEKGTWEHADGATMPEETELIITGAGSKSFDAITFQKAGTYTFIISETDSQVNGYKYDTTVYTITVVVSEDENTHDTHIDSVTVNGTTVTVADNEIGVTFTNTYTPKPTTLPIPVIKNVAGETPEGDETFNFVLTADGTNPAGAQLPENTGLAITGPGSDNFDGITFTQAGLYTFTVTETPGSAYGYHYDGATWTVTVNVIDDNGDLKVESVTYAKDGVTQTDADGVTFTNTFTPDVWVILEAGKTLNNAHGKSKDLTAGQFSFTLAGTGAAPMPENPTATNDADGKVIFDKIVFTEEDVGSTYTYTITEDKGTRLDMNYDKTVYTVEITVKKENDVLKAEVKYYEGTGDDKAELAAGALPAFVNTLVAPDLTIEKEQSLSTSGGVEKVARTKNALYANGYDIITYYLTVKNDSPATAYDLTVTDVIPELLALKAGTITSDRASATFGTEESAGITTITWKLDALESGGTWELTFQVTVPSDRTAATQWTNVGDLTYRDEEPQPVALAAGYDEATGIYSVKTNAVQSFTGALTVSKTVNDAQPDPNETFSFTVTLDDKTFNGEFNGLNFTEGVATFTLKHGESITIPSIAPGTPYSVTESADGYITAWDGNNSSIPMPTPEPAAEECTQSGMVELTGTAAAAVICENTPIPPESLIISKTVVVKDANGNLVELTEADMDKVFSFTVTLLPAEGGVLADSYDLGEYGTLTRQADGSVTGTITLKHGESVEITGLPAGTQYTVTETTDGVYVPDEAEKTGHTAEEGVIVSFTNTRVLPAPGSLTIEKTVTGAGDTERTFTFRVVFSDNGSYSYTRNDGTTGILTSGDTIQLKHGESITIQDIPANTGYTVTELEADQDGYTTTATNDSGTIPAGGSLTASFVNHKADEPDDPTDPTEPTEPTQPPVDDEPKTGDLWDPAPWILLMAASAIGMVVTFVLGKRSRRDGRDR